MLTVEQLKEYGANTEEGLGRCMNNEGFYLMLVGKVVQDQNFAALDEALKRNDLDAAFEAAHALKGATGNLALTPLYEPICEVTELLRKRTQMDYSAYQKTINSCHQQLVALIK